jgi:hypothetical protein
MTYFTYRRVRGTRSVRVYVGSTLIGRVAVMPDWRSRFTLSDTAEVRYRAVGMAGDKVPLIFASRHDAAEALYEGARNAPGETAPPTNIQT